MSEPRIVRTGERAVVAFDGDLTSSTVLDVRPRLGALMGGGVRELVFDFGGTDFVDSSGIGMLLSAHNWLSKAGGHVEVVGASEEILSLFRSMRLDKRFPLAGRDGGGPEGPPVRRT
jgi:anti-anti-sigma factor